MSFAEPVPRSTPLRAALLVVSVVVLLGLGAAMVAVLAVVGLRSGQPPAAPPVVTATALPDAVGGAGGAGGAAGATSRAREVLREWDRRRESAWSTADETALAALYLPGAVAGRRDVALLRRWSSRGARVDRLQPQVLALRVLREGPRRLVVRVTDRLGIVSATVAGEPVVLPRDGPSVRRIDLRRGPPVTSRWRVASVRVLEAPGTLGG